MRHYGLGAGKWVFVDWVGVEPGYGTRWDGEVSTGFCVPQGVALRVHRPDVVRAPAVALDRPWERGLVAYATVLHDQGLLRCWYEHGGGMGYAESDDGVTWRKPDLGQRDVDGSTKNNLVASACYGHGLFIDPGAPAAERYKMVGCRWREDERAVVGAVSPDGLHWTPLDEPILPGQHADTQNVCERDDALGRYVLYTRQTDGVMQRRGVNRSESADFRRFPPSEPVLESTPLDPADWDIYCSGYSRWPGAVDAHVMRLSMYKRTPDVIDVHLATSRDGHTWHRPQGCTPWIDGGAWPGDPYPSVYATTGIVPTGPGEWSTYVGVSPIGHNQPVEPDARHDGGLVQARLREDGFMSLSAEGRGQFWTIPFVLRSDTIRVNVRTRYSGMLRAELVHSAAGETGSDTRDMHTIDGFMLADCRPIAGDHVDAPLAWHAGSDLRRFRGETVRLRFDLYKADLYAIRF